MTELLSLPKVLGKVGYLASLDLYKAEKPFFSNIPFFNIPGAKQQNLSVTDHEKTPIYDVRGREHLVSLDTCGFEIRRHPTVPSEAKFHDEEWIRREYWPEIQRFVKKELGASEVKIFDHTVRRANPTSPIYVRGGMGRREPSAMAHVDQTSQAAEQRVWYHMKDEAEKLLKGRYQIINVWHPLFGPIRHRPLGLCDYNSVNQAKDLEASDLIFPHYVGEQWYSYHSPNHRWYYISDQMPDECWLFKCHDSLTDGTAKYAMHTAIVLPKEDEERPRESIEFRCLVFYE
ncbi:uncharacterized protein BDZ99DRAFT_536502 [Mytilinidion resinicola]|uniref:Methyltransferase n=1 Tax=Mytilinidion resinicola TaxID=574789 RepID=A0A6A6YF32_9PEZI|nr:uncharacterized protein BDZ99DRAFT_536502 [Mytilinidion resinicola]KAF2807219.1 hypothetical protein BDZ99DRAFT_536502 [Mytilinidion resinicola]